MKAKKLVFSLVASLLLFIGILEYLYQTNKLYRHELDYQINKLDKLHNKKYDTLLLSDSITRTPLWNIKLNRDVLNLTNSAASSVAGNYFMLKRFFDKGNTVKKVYFFLSPILLKDNIGKRFSYSHFESIFNLRDEKYTMLQIGRNDLYNRKDYFHKRYMALMKTFGLKKDNKRIYKNNVYIDNENLLYLDKKNTKRNKNAIINFSNREYKLSDISNVFLKKIITLLKENNTNIIFVVEPMPKSVYTHYLSSIMHKELIKIINSERTIDINKFSIFPDYAFYDGEHLKDGWKNIYNKIIDKKVVNIFPNIKKSKRIFKTEEKILIKYGTIFRGEVVNNKGYYKNLCASFTIEVQETKNYKLFLDVYAKDEYSNSFYIKRNNEKNKTFHIPVNKKYAYSKKYLSIQLDRGLNYITLCNRENTYIKEFILK